MNSIEVVNRRRRQLRSAGRNWYRKNRDKILALRKQKYLANPDKYRLWAQEYRRRYAEKIRKRNRLWYRNHPEYKAVKNALARKAYALNPDQARARNRQWRDCHRETVNAARREREAERYRTDSEFRKRRREIRRKYEREHPEGFRKRWLKHKYGITPEKFRAILQSQGGGCAICGNTNNASSKKHLDLDHNRQTGKVRGVLCNNCNRAIGHFHESIIRLKAAVAYLEQYSTSLPDSP